MWSLSVPSSLSGWGQYLLTVGIPIMVMFALSTRVFAVADNIYDGANNS